jgi:hypothetical protein
MKIFVIMPDYDEKENSRYDALLPKRGADWSKTWRFDCSPKAGYWPQNGADVYLVDPMLPRADLPWLTDGVVVLGPRAEEVLLPIVQVERNELLPLNVFGGERNVAVNILPCHACIDEEATDWHQYTGGPANRAKRFQFLKDRLPETSLFKASATPFRVFAIERSGSPAHEFKACVEALDLKGLAFREVWNDDGGSISPLPRLGIG